MASGAVNTACQLSFAIGIAVLGTLFTSRIGSYLADHATPHAGDAAHALSGGQAQRVLHAVPAGRCAELDSAIHAAMAGGLHTVLIVAGVVGLVAGLAAPVLIRPAKVSTAGTSAGAAADPQLVTV